MFGLLRLSDHLDRIKDMFGDRGAANTIDASHCVDCGSCCWARPGDLNKDDILRIAEHLKTTPEQLFKTKLCVDILGAESGLVLMFIRKDQADLAGKFVPNERTFDLGAPCLFRDDETNRCEIHEVKPTVCCLTCCWNPAEEYTRQYWTEEELKRLGWSGDKYEAEGEDYDDGE